jgi:hypothetical protein
VERGTAAHDLNRPLVASIRKPFQSVMFNDRSTKNQQRLCLGITRILIFPMEQNEDLNYRKEQAGNLLC